MDLENRVNSLKKLVTIGVISLAVLCSSCSTFNSSSSTKFNLKGITSKPKSRMGYYPSDTIGTQFRGPDVGKHSYKDSLSEKIGIVFTRRVGHVDLSHLRKTADWTAYLASKTYGHLMENQAEFSFNLKDGSKHFVELTYPKNWEKLSEQDKEKNVKEISIRLGEYFGFTGNTWHEIITWFGYQSLFPFSDFPSAFSWEDSFSNLLGSYIGANALREDSHSFNEAVTTELDNELKKLDVQPRSVAKKASTKMKGKGYTGQLMFVNMKKRYFDIGIDDGYITPVIIDIDECGKVEPLSYPVPNTDFLNKYGFSMRYEIELKGSYGKKIQKIIGKKRINPKTDFSAIMNYIKKKAIEKYGKDVDVY